MKVIEFGGVRGAIVDGALHQIGAPVPGNMGRCYELSAQRVAGGPDGRAMFTGGYQGAVLVNGTIQGVDSGPIGHAWVIGPGGQHGGEPARDSIYPIAVFEAIFEAIPEVTYDAHQARHQMATAGHYGPWH